MRLLFVLFFMIYSTNILSKEIDVRTFIPPQALSYFPLIKEETKRLFPDFILPAYFGALIEHESCINLLHRRCWSPKSRLKTSREEGAGFLQITRAYKLDGTIRFDSLTELVIRNKIELREFTWNTVYDRPDLQIRAIVLLYKDSYNNISLMKVPRMQRLAMADSAYNGGIRDVIRSRTVCGLVKDCDPNIWFNNVESYNVKNKTKILYGTRTAFDINNNHVRDVILVRSKKYIDAFKQH